MAIPNNLLNNAVLVNYWNLVRGDNKTVLTEKELYQCGVMVKMVDLIPPTGSAIYLIDGLSEKQLVVLPINQYRTLSIQVLQTM